MQKYTFIQKLSVLFGAGVIGIVVCLVMSIYTGIQESKPKEEVAPHSIPTPALGQ